MTHTSSTALPMSMEELIEWTCSVACDVRAGLYDVRSDADHRWHTRLYADERVDLWLISWTQDQGTQLHDHGGSAGAFTVVGGTLEEASWSAGRDDGGHLVRQSRAAGDTVVFGPHYVHDVVNREEATAVSVHAYSPPLSTMNFYDVEMHRLVKLTTMWTDDPEQPMPESAQPWQAAS